MKMNKQVAYGAQGFLELLTSDDMSTAFIFTGTFPHNNWQPAVELIYRLLMCKIIGCEYLPDAVDIKEYCEDLARTNPEHSLDFWVNLELSITSKGKQLLKKYIPEIFQEPSVWAEFNIGLIDELEEIFKAYGLEWDKEHPLFPVANNSQPT